MYLSHFRPERLNHGLREVEKPCGRTVGTSSGITHGRLKNLFVRHETPTEIPEYDSASTIKSGVMLNGE